MNFKRVLLIPVFLFFVFFAGSHDDGMKLKDATTGSTIFQVAGTGTVYTQTFNSSPNMTLNYAVWDTTGADSVAVVISYQTLLGNFFGAERWKTQVSTTTITADSSYDDWIITANTIGNSRKARIIVTGQTGNDITVGSLIRLELDHYEER